MIAAYVERLARALDFDPSLSRRVRDEVEDHLWEAVARNVTDPPAEAARHAVASFGDPHALAGRFAVVSAARRARRNGIVAVSVIAAVFVAMKARVTWYSVMEPAAGAMGALGQLVVSIDRVAFWLAVLLGSAGWIYIDSRRIPPVFTQQYRTQLRRFSLVCAAAAAALVASVISDAVLTSLRLVGAATSLRLAVPLVSMAIEVAGVGGLLASLRVLTRRTASASDAARIGDAEPAR